MDTAARIRALENRIKAICEEHRKDKLAMVLEYEKLQQQGRDYMYRVILSPSKQPNKTPPPNMPVSSDQSAQQTLLQEQIKKLELQLSNVIEAKEKLNQKYSNLEQVSAKLQAKLETCEQQTVLASNEAEKATIAANTEKGCKLQIQQLVEAQKLQIQELTAATEEHKRQHMAHQELELKLQKKVKKYKQQINEVQQQLDNSISENNAKQKAAQEYTNDLEQVISSLQTENNECKTSLESMNKTYQEYSQFMDKKITKSLEKIDKLEEDKEALLEANENLQKQLKSQMKCEAEASSDELVTIQEKLLLAEEQINKLRKENQTLLQKEESNCSIIDTLKIKISEAEAENCSILRNKEELSLQLSRNNDRIATLLRNEQSQNTQIEELTRTVASLNRSNQNLHATSTSASDNIEKLSEQITKLKNKKTELEASINQAIASKEQLLDKYEALKSRSDSFTTQLDELNVAIAAERKRNTELENKINSLEDAKAALKSELASQEDKYQQIIQQTEQELKANVTTIEQQLGEANAQLANTKAELQEKVSQAQKHFEVGLKIKGQAKALKEKYSFLKQKYEKQKLRVRSSQGSQPSSQESSQESNANSNLPIMKFAASPSKSQPASSSKSPAKRQRPKLSQTTIPINSPKKRKLNSKPVVIISGIDAQIKRNYERIIESIGGRVTPNFDKTVSHIICPTSVRTLKTLAATLTGKWRVSLQWVTDSKEAGKFLDEKQYGTNELHNPLYKKKIFLSNSFPKEHADKMGYLKEIALKLGNASFTPSRADADIIMVADEEPQSKKHEYTWKRLLELIQPINNDN